MTTARLPRAIALRALAGLVAAALALAACGGADTTDTPATKTKPDPIGSEIDVTAGTVVIQSAGPPDIVLADEVRDQIVSSVRAYITIASVEPLLTGELAGDLNGLLTPAAAVTAGGIDRGVLTDEGLPAATETVVARASPITLTVLVDQASAMVLITAALDVGITTATAQGEVTIFRSGELTFAPDDGLWRIAGFDLAVTRNGAGVDAAAGVTDPEIAP